MPKRISCVKLGHIPNTVPCYSFVDAADQETHAYNSKCMVNFIALGGEVTPHAVGIQPIHCAPQPDDLADLRCPRCRARVYSYAAFNHGNANTAYIPVTQNLKPINP
jgi:hypothetical protein